MFRPTLLNIHLPNYGCTLCNTKPYNVLHRILRNNSSTPVDDVEIPKRIPRGPTDILRAIASTVKRDPTAAHYKYHDDPYLIPMSNIQKRVYSLSQESGKKAAMWIKQQHPQLFMHVEADPPIEAYLARATYDEEDDVNNEILSKVIKDAFLQDAVTVYQLMKKKEVEVSLENKQALLELLCFFNEKEDLPEELIEERWFSQSSNPRQSLKKTWKDGSYAEQLFEEMPRTPESYSAIIRGMTKYYQVNKAYEYYKEAQEKGIVLSVGAYNSMLKVVPFIREGFQKRWELTEEFLKTMSSQGVKPNLGTMNAVLEVFTMTASVKEAKTLALQVIAEMKQLGIEPSLATYRHLLALFCGERSEPAPYLLHDIIQLLEGKQLKIQEKDDILFFVTAMEKCRFSYADKDLAYRIHALLTDGDNYNFIGDSYKESVYYRHFFILLCQTETLENLMNQYDLLVPHVYVPEPAVMEEIIRTVTMNGASEYYNRIFDDIIWFEMFDKQTVMQTFITGMVLNRSPWSTPPSQSAVQLGDIAWTIYDKVENPDEFTRKRIEWSATLLGDLMMLCLCADNFEKGSKIFEKLKSGQLTIVGVPSIESLALYVDVCINRKDVRKAIECLEYVYESGFGEVDDIARKIASNMILSKADRLKIASIAGTHVFPSAKENEKVQAASS